MKLFLIEREDPIGYDCYDGHVIAADNESEVREMAKEHAAEEGPDKWDNAKITEIGIYTGEETTPIFILSSYNAG